MYFMQLSELIEDLYKRNNSLEHKFNSLEHKLNSLEHKLNIHPVSALGQFTWNRLPLNMYEGIFDQIPIVGAAMEDVLLPPNRENHIKEIVTFTNKFRCLNGKT